MSKEMICKNCKYHYIEEISFDYPQSCCHKRKAVIEEWFNCNDFEYSDKYIKQLKKQLEEYKDKINWYENFEVNKTIDKLRLKHNVQQKEFIKWLEKKQSFLRDEISELTLGMCNTDFQDIKIEVYEKVLQKYKEIIGDGK